MVLDRARLGKQRVECSQILRALEGRSVMSEPEGERRSGWVSHPATKMWAGYEPALQLYMSCVVMEWERRGYTNNMTHPYHVFRIDGPELEQVHHALVRDGATYPSLPDPADVTMPPWLGDPEFHASHRSRLLEKDPTWYGGLGWTEEPGREYTWPLTSD